MWSMIMVLGVAFVAWTWVRASRRNRTRWLEGLSLPGAWRWDTDGPSHGRLELTGGYSGGRYRLLEGDSVEEGAWRVDGYDLVFEPDRGAACRATLRHFDQGRIGLDCPERPRRIYVKATSNVVPLGRARP